MYRSADFTKNVTGTLLVSQDKPIIQNCKKFEILQKCKPKKSETLNLNSPNSVKIRNPKKSETLRNPKP
jgi:hypothetical protein